MMTEAALASFVAALFSVMNPIGNVGIFASLTEGRDGAQARRTAWTCAASVAIILLIVTWTGSMLLEFFGITVNALRAAGGVIVFLIGLNMLNNNKSHQQNTMRPRRALPLPSCRSPFPSSQDRASWRPS